MYWTNDIKVILHQEDLPSKVQQIYFRQILVCWSDTGLLDFLGKNLSISTQVFGKN